MRCAALAVALHALLQPVVRALRAMDLSRDAAIFTGLVLGCIETKFCKQNMRWKALAEIYTMRSFALL